MMIPQVASSRQSTRRAIEFDQSKDTRARNDATNVLSVRWTSNSVHYQQMRQQIDSGYLNQAHRSGHSPL